MECPESKKGQQEGPEGHQESISQSGQTVVPGQEGGRKKGRGHGEISKQL